MKHLDLICTLQDVHESCLKFEQARWFVISHCMPPLGAIHSKNDISINIDSMTIHAHVEHKTLDMIHVQDIYCCWRLKSSTPRFRNF